ncbi:RNA-binding protein 39-like isoform X1 [Juglans microcarpa x Juglans regia]|uniref:RNA-binding protein 39-like isoform X1 n=1 Tax=Juglans microcarpa x Juglans regia TaxID=2249226 RepID=UPI001B7DA074|nr:RNA-binding protein 39-like isoform X1 [Juglans microcarpa x Juglans regia]
MDFDAYDYLEKTVENLESQKDREDAVNGSGEIEKSREKDHSRRSKHRSDERDDYVERWSKRSRSDDDLHDRDVHRERGSSHQRSRSRDGERDRHKSVREHKDKERDRDRYKDREERNGKERDKDRYRELDHDRGKDKRERVRESESEREREREREGSHRSRSRSDKHQSEHDERERSHDREYKEREMERELRERDRESRRYKEKKEEGTEPEADPERDQRTVFAYQISLKANERDVYEFFSRAGKVRDVRLIMDRNSRRSKGVGYIEFYDAMSVPMAIALSGQLLLGQPVMVKPSEAEKNLVQSTTVVAGVSGGLIGPYSGGARRLYVGNLHFNMTEADLRQVFEAFGQVELVQLPLDETGHCKGFGFVQFARLEDSRNALSLNQQLEIAGRLIKVSAVTDQTGLQDIGANSGDFDDDEGGGLSLNARSRALLMQKLDRSGTASGISGSVGTPAVNGTGLTLPMAPVLGAAPVVSPGVAPLPSIPALAGLGVGLQGPIATMPTVDTIGVPSECLLLKDMFDPKIETEPDFDLDIKEDVREECSKYGNLKHIFVDKHSAGFVYLRFENTQAAAAAQRALHGRWFAGKMITATYMLPQAYETKFPDSR